MGCLFVSSQFLSRESRVRRPFLVPVLFPESGHVLMTVFWATFFGPALGVTSWSALGCHFPVSVLCPDSGLGSETSSEMESGVGDHAQFGWLICGLTGSAVGHWTVAFD